MIVCKLIDEKISSITSKMQIEKNIPKKFQTILINKKLAETNEMSCDIYTENFL